MNGELDRWVTLVEDSLVWRAVARPLAAAAAAWPTSLIGRTGRAWSTQLSSWPQSRRIRFVALTIGFAAAVHASILPAVPLYARPGIPVRWLAFVVGGAMVAAVCAGAIAAAWSGSVMGTLARQIASYRSAGK